MKKLTTLNQAVGLFLTCGTLVYGALSSQFSFADENKDKYKPYTSHVVKKEDADKIFVGPDLNKVDIYIPNDSGQGVMSAGIEYLNQKSRVPAHIHSKMEEIIFIVKGEGLALVDGKTQRVSPGDMLLITPNTGHGLTNVGEEELEFFVVYSDNDMVDFFRDYAFKDRKDVKERFSPDFMRNLFQKHHKSFAVTSDVVTLFPKKDK